MIIPKMLINQVASYLTKHFKLDKVMSYVFDKNELDTKVEGIEKRLSIIENFKCNYKKEEENG
tara:strand:- start:9785 stop:9973 length:189 start_codon:yes stop_codon:yes gene_type:complete